MTMQLRSYMQQLQTMAEAAGTNLLDAFTAAGIADSTYYRALAGSYHLSYGTARKVADWLDAQASAAA